MTARRRFSVRDWAVLGLRALSEDGPEAVRLEAICGRAGLTRGSFYYHFKDHSAFLKVLAHEWKKQATDGIADQLPEDKSSPQTAQDLTEAALQIDYRLELGIRELARRSPVIADIVKTADARRLDILTTLYADRFGLERDVAQNYAYLEYSAFSGMILLNPDLPRDMQLKLANLFDALIKKALHN